MRSRRFHFFCWTYASSFNDLLHISNLSITSHIAVYIPSLFFSSRHQQKVNSSDMDFDFGSREGQDDDRDILAANYQALKSLAILHLLDFDRGDWQSWGWRRYPWCVVVISQWKLLSLRRYFYFFYHITVFLFFIAKRRTWFFFTLHNSDSRTSTAFSHPTPLSG